MRWDYSREISMGRASPRATSREKDPAWARQVRMKVQREIFRTRSFSKLTGGPEGKGVGAGLGASVGFAVGEMDSCIDAIKVIARKI